jgi:hypothetical protein
MGSPIVQAGGTDAGNTLADTAISVITQRMITALKQIAALRNRQAIDGYKAQLAQTTANNLTNVSLGIAPFPLPQIPLLMQLNEQVVIDNEQGVGEKDWSKVYDFVAYQPVPPQPPPVHPVVIDPNEDEDYPGYHIATSGDGGDVPIGAQSPTQADGHVYRKAKVGRSPFAPGGFITRWQQIS